MEPNTKKLEGAGHLQSPRQMAGPSPFSKAPVLADAWYNPPTGIRINQGWEGLDLAKVKKLLETSFGKKLSDDYFKDPAECVIVHENYQGIAIIKRIDGVAYLDKYAVAPEKRGNGVGREVWGMMKEIYPSLMWRAHKQNPINGWYETNSEGSRETENWKVFWCGAIGPVTIDMMVQKISAREPSFIS